VCDVSDDSIVILFLPDPTQPEPIPLKQIGREGLPGMNHRFQLHSFQGLDYYMNVIVHHGICVKIVALILEVTQTSKDDRPFRTGQVGLILVNLPIHGIDSAGFSPTW
jgi:hypothetical protein